MFTKFADNLRIDGNQNRSKLGFCCQFAVQLCTQILLTQVYC